MDNTKKIKIAVIGMGYVGIPAAVLLADVEGFEVVGVQRRSERSGWKVDALNRGECPILNEPILPDLIKKVVLEKKSFKVVDNFDLIKNMDYILIDVQTPTEKDTNKPKYESLKEVAEKVGSSMKKGATVIIESTIAPGTTDYIVKPVLEKHASMKVGKDFHLVHSYERVMVGRLLYNIINYPRIVGGVTDKCSEKGVWLYKHIVKEKLIPVKAIIAEVAKVVENSYRDVQIAFANEVALACESFNIDFNDVRKCVNSLPINSNAYRDLHLPGAGVGGHCLPKDTWLLQFGLDAFGKKKTKMNLMINARNRNDLMPTHILELAKIAAEKAGIKFSKAKIAVLGASFIENSEDTRNSPTETLVKLLEKNKLQWIIHDPFVRQNEFPYPIMKDLPTALKGADILILMVKHKEYFDLKPQWLKQQMRTAIVIDGRNVFDLEQLKKEKIIAYGIGKANY